MDGCRDGLINLSIFFWSVLVGQVSSSWAAFTVFTDVSSCFHCKNCKSLVMLFSNVGPARTMAGAVAHSPLELEQWVAVCTWRPIRQQLNRIIKNHPKFSTQRQPSRKP